MKTLIKILCLSVLWFSCENSTEPEPEGCDGIPGSGLEFDECGVCDGDGVDEDEDGICDDIDDCIEDCGGSCNNENVEIWSWCYNISETTSLEPHESFTDGQVIPPEIGQLINLTTLDLYNKKLLGVIPVEIGDIVNLRKIQLGNNQLSGEIPQEIGNLSNLTELYLYGNDLTGEIPLTIWNMTNLNSLYLDNNQLTGEIPLIVENLINLYSLDLEDNQLTGEIPQEICNQGDNSPSLSNNQFCPPYPTCLTQNDVGVQDTSNCP